VGQDCLVPKQLAYNMSIQTRTLKVFYGWAPVKITPKKPRTHHLSADKQNPLNAEPVESRKIPVLVANRSRLMRELLRSLLTEHTDIEIVDAVEPEANLAEHLSRSHARFLIVDFQDGARFCNALIPKFQDLKILAIPAKKTFSRIYWADRGIHSQRVVTSIEGVLCALRESSWKLQSGAIVGLQKAS